MHIPIPLTLNQHSMKKITCLMLCSVIVLLSLMNSGCKKSSSSDDSSSSTPSPMGSTGNTFTGSITGLTDFTATITQVTGGVSTISCGGTITDPVMKSIVPMLNSSSIMNIDPTTGSFTVGLKAKFTMEGIVDYFASDGSPSVLISYSAKVGDVYTCKNAEGHTFTREVTAVSTTDDYFWGGMLIKTATVKEISSVRGVDKIEYRTNHKFGLVGIKIYMQDASTYLFPVYSSTYNQ
jgi:hypothetical protein